MHARVLWLTIPVLTLPCLSFGAGPTVLYSTIQSSPTSDIPGLPGQKFRSGTGTQIQRPFRSPDGNHWGFRAFVQGAATAEDEILFSGSGLTGSMKVRENTATGLLQDELWNIFDERIALDNAGNIAFANNTSAATTADEVVARWNAATNDFTLIAREGGSTAIPGAIYGVANSTANITGDGRIGFLATSLTGVATAVNAAIFTDNGSTVLAQKGVTQPAPGFTWDLFDTDDFRLNADGTQYLIKGDMSGDTTKDDILVRNGVIVMTEGEPVPGSSFTSPIANGFAA